MFIKKKKNCFIRFADGETFMGESICFKRNLFSEIVFNTSNTGYQEVITDPSYSNQSVIFSTSHLGNTGWNYQDNESNKIWLNCIIVKDIFFYKNASFRSKKNIINILNKNKIVVVISSDTRTIIKKIRSFRKNFVIISHCKFKEKNIKTKFIKLLKYSGNKLFSFNENSLLHFNFFYCFFFVFKILVIDCGLKKNILRKLSDNNSFLIITKFNFNIELIKKVKPDGIVISNGPGNPKYYKELIKNTENIINKFPKIPILGICFGHQVISLSQKIKVYKMKFGHHGINHPVRFINKYFISSQNHNFFVKKKNKIHSLFDGSNQGLKYKNIISFQGHPEASPGPEDFKFLFKKFKTLINEKN